MRGGLVPSIVRKHDLGSHRAVARIFRLQAAANLVDRGFRSLARLIMRRSLIQAQGARRALVQIRPKSWGEWRLATAPANRTQLREAFRPREVDLRVREWVGEPDFDDPEVALRELRSLRPLTDGVVR